MELLKYYSGPATETLNHEAQILTEAQAFREYMDRNNQNRKLARSSAKPRATSTPKRKKTEPQRREKITPEMTWLKKLICPFVYAEKTPDGIRPSVTKEAFIGRWNMRMGQRSLPNYKLLDHFNGTETLYFMGQGWNKADRTLANIDIDVQKHKRRGTPEGARQFAEHLKQKWPDLYCEPSTNGNGIHGYCILWKRKADAQTTNAALKRLEAWLRAEAKRINADIEDVEIKGTCLDLTLDDRFAQAVTFGVPAKLPRDVSRFSEWENTTVLRVKDLESSLYDVSVREAMCEAAVVVNEPEEAVQFPASQSNAPARKEKKPIVAGSVSNKFINDDQLDSIPAFERLYREWVGPSDLMAGKFRVTAHDFAVAMVLLRHFKADVNLDKSLPCRRVAELWTGLYKAGDIDRGWNHHRWKVIRDFLSARGHIDWTDHRYEHPSMVKDEHGKWCRQKDNNGKRSRGIACKWVITDEYDHRLEQVSLITALKTGEASFVDTKFNTLVPKQGKGRNLRPTICSLRHLKFWQQTNEASELLFAA